MKERKEALVAAANDVVRHHGPTNQDNPYENPLGATFTEFSKAVLLDKIWNEHWVAYEKFCAPCAMKYDVIAKFETLDRDNMFVVKTAGLNETQWAGHSNPTSSGGTGEETWKSYFKQLDRGLLELYREMYKVDCQLFGYDCSVGEFHEGEMDI